MRHVDALISILRLKNETEVTWGVEQQEAFEKIKIYLSSPLVLKAPRRGFPFRLYVAAGDKVIGVVLTKKTKDKEFVINPMLNNEIRYDLASHRSQRCTSQIIFI